MFVITVVSVIIVKKKDLKDFCHTVATIFQKPSQPTNDTHPSKTPQVTSEDELVSTHIDNNNNPRFRQISFHTRGLDRPAFTSHRDHPCSDDNGHADCFS